MSTEIKGFLNSAGFDLSQGIGKIVGDGIKSFAKADTALPNQKKIHLQNSL